MSKIQKEYLRQLEECPIVRFVKVVDFSAAATLLKSKVTKKDYLKLEGNSKEVFVFFIRYISNKKEISGFVIIPRIIEDKRIPSIIYNRGGSFNFGAITYGLLWGDISTMARWGYIVAASQYSGNGGSEGKDDWGGENIYDSLVLKKVIASLSIANGKIGMFGESRGGMVTYRAVSQVSWVNAAVSIGGVSNLERVAKQRPEMKEIFQRSFGGSIFEMRKRSAIYFAQNFAKETPLLMLHGLADWRVSAEDSIDLSKKLQKHAISHRLILYEGADHQLTEVRTHYMREVQEWFERFLIKSSPLPKLGKHGK